MWDVNAAHVVVAGLVLWMFAGVVVAAILHPFLRDAE